MVQNFPPRPQDLDKGFFPCHFHFLFVQILEFYLMSEFIVLKTGGLLAPFLPKFLQVVLIGAPSKFSQSRLYTGPL